jgi:site-specific DNA-methyltransferase (adenine-specific)
MKKIGICNQDCFATMKRMENKNFHVDIILTSPPYNTGRPSTSEKSRETNNGRYDVHLDTMTHEEYREWSVDLFTEFDKILNNNGVILYNLSYGPDGSINTSGIGLMWNVISDIIDKTNFTVVDRIIWKKSNALPNNSSSNKLTRIVEDIFVFVRKNEYKTFNCNKAIKSTSTKGQKYYENIFNFIEAKNNDGKCSLNKATYSSELCKKLLKIYANENSIIYDPFMGSGTTAVACKEMNLECYGSEISTAQCQFANERISQIK